MVLNMFFHIDFFPHFLFFLANTDRIYHLNDLNTAAYKKYSKIAETSRAFSEKIGPANEKCKHFKILLWLFNSNNVCFVSFFSSKVVIWLGNWKCLIRYWRI